MNKAYFFRDIKNIKELKQRTKEAIQNGATPISFNIYNTIELNKNDYEKFVQRIFEGHPKFESLKFGMVSNFYGIWNCILVQSKEFNEKIIIYYGGFHYPRFVALIDNSLKEKKEKENYIWSPWINKLFKFFN